MPILTFVFTFLSYLWFKILTPRVQQESHLCAHTEVPNNHVTEFLEEAVSLKFCFVSVLSEEIVGKRDGVDLHDVSDIQILDPFVLVQKSEDRSHVWHLLLIFLASKLL